MGIGHEPLQKIVPYQATGSLSATVALDEDGRFTWHGLWPGRWRVFLSAPGTEQQELRIDVGADEAEHTWTLARRADARRNRARPGR